ncbi:MAG: hypothetical protein A2826_00670 [Candidatus Doudnabacteria bacterium RIFCSPHIGHO2_01_FULL_43_23]|uniref:Phosphoribosyltransferase domain-containing protein n=1 Tax=Candidatus Doudnabacteria bacterium RIFCSPHIGHO2_01_FULL_43_23 TaxID=1817822 RepID=A0A1F5NTX1_9BACT|nr:MAG: hypothetical protein A2826_00670 [Candidatus Doudnabacteria bacterium RIFCSPHIGHO2_01_FULL_43_23]
MLQKTFNFFLDLILPKTCRVCGAFDTWLCEVCQGKIVLNVNQFCPVCVKPSVDGHTHANCGNRNTLDGLLAASDFDQLQDLVHSYKYDLIKDLGLPLGKILTGFVEQKNYVNFVKNFVIVPVPLHKTRKRFRGFNQSEILAQVVAEKFRLTQKNLLLQRSKNTSPQTKLDRNQRKQNILGAITAEQKDYIKDKKILLIDDIATTGATLNECAKVLKKYGAREVWGLVLAHG